VRVVSDPGRAYLDRLALAIDVRLIDDVARWPALAARAGEIVEHIRATAATRKRVFDQLSTEERLLHAVAQALGGELDERDARAIHDHQGYSDRDVPFVAIVLASRGIDTARALDTYTLALLEPLPDALGRSLQLAFERGFPPPQAHRLGPQVVGKLLERWPGARWSRVVRALGGDDAGLARLAIEDPLLVANAGSRVIDALLARPDRHERLIQWLPRGTPEQTAVRLDLVARSVAWRLPLPRAPIRDAIARADPEAGGPEAIAAATIAAVGAGDLETARRLCRSPALPDVETTAARTLAMLGGDAGEVRALWSLVPEGETTSPVVAANAALFALELDDRPRLRELAVPLTAARATMGGRIVLARVYLGAGQRELADNVLAGDDSPVARLLRARSLAAIDRTSAIAQLASLVEMFPGWAEARLRLGLAWAAVDPKRAFEILDAPAADDRPDSAVLGPPGTARAAARLAAGELLRRGGAPAGAARAIRDALARAPASPMIARQAAVLAVALRAPELAREAQRRLEALTPGAKIIERLVGALHELAGDRARATVSYRSAGAWDRVVVLGARARKMTPARQQAALAAGIEVSASGSFSLPPAFDVEDATSVAALYAAAVSAQHRDPSLAVRALERAALLRPDHRGLADDLVAMRVHRARAAAASGDLTAVMAAAQDLERALDREPDQPRIREALAHIAIAITARWIRDGEHDRARVRLDELHARLGTPLIALHALALAIRTLHVDDARRWLARAPAGDHRELLAALLAALLGDDAGVRERLPGLVNAAGFVGSAARLLDLVHRGTPGELAAWCFDHPAEVVPLGSDVALFIAYALAGAVGDRPSDARIAAFLEEVAASFEADGARRARLVALGLRAASDPPEPLALDAIDLGQLEHTAERDLAIGLVAFETRRRRAASDSAGADAALDRLVQLVRPAGAAGILARTSIEAAAETACSAWRAGPESAAALQAALATQLRRAIDRELAGRSDEDCRAAWRTVVALLGPVLAGDRAWRALACHRERIYKVPAHELAAARDACGRRIADILGQLARWHAARGDAVQPAARFEEVRQLLANEIAIARTLQAVLSTGAITHVLPIALGPLGIDLLGRRAEVIEALAAVPAGSDVAAEVADVRGILVGALVDGWLALHDGRYDVAERVVRQRIAAVGRVEPDATGLLTAVYVRRIRDTLDDDDLLAAADLAQGWSREDTAHGMPEQLALQIAALCDRLHARYKLGRPRRLLQHLRTSHDAHPLRQAEASLIARHLDELGGAAGLESIELCVAAVGLAPSDDLRAHLRHHVATALRAATQVKQVDAILQLLQAAPDPVRVAEGLLTAQIRRSELGDAALSSTGYLEARIEALRQTLDVARSAALAVRGVAERLVILHERLAEAYRRRGNDGEAARHVRRAIAYRSWSQP
jgi:tetratricopeptide (TPR) repeat protein